MQREIHDQYYQKRQSALNACLSCGDDNLGIFAWGGFKRVHCQSCGYPGPYCRDLEAAVYGWNRLKEVLDVN
jgi:hypothetical protein